MNKCWHDEANARLDEWDRRPHRLVFADRYTCPTDDWLMCPHCRWIGACVYLRLDRYQCMYCQKYHFVRYVEWVGWRVCRDG